MLKKFLLLTAATVSIYASSSEENDQSDRNSRVAAVNVGGNQEVRNMEKFKTGMTNLVNNLVSSLSSEKESLISQVTTLSTALTTAKSDLGKKTEELDDLQKKFNAAVSEHKEQLATASNEAKTKMSGELTSLKEKIKTAEADKENLQSVCDEIKKQLNDTHKTISSNEETMQQLQQKLDETQSSNTLLTAENASKATVIAKLQADITTKQNSLTAAEKLVESKTAELERVQNELDYAKKNGASLNAEQQQQLAALQSDLATAKAAFETAEKELAGLRTERDKAVADLDLANKKVQPYQNFMNLHNTKYPTIDEQGNPMADRSRLHRTPSDIWTDANDELPKVRQQLEDLQKEHAELQNKLANNPDMSAVVAQLREEVVNVQQQAANMQQDYETMKNDSLSFLEAAKDKVSSLSEQLQNEQVARKDVEDRLTKVSEAMKRMEIAAAGNNDLVTQLQMQATELQKAKAEAEMQEKAAAQKLANADAQRQKRREVKISERAANASKSLRSIVSSQAESDERSKAIFESTISKIQIKNMLDFALQAGIDVSDADKDLLSLQNNKTYTNNAAGDAERTADDKKIIESKQAAAKQLLLALRAKAKQLKIDNPDGLDTAVLIGNIQSKIKKQ